METKKIRILLADDNRDARSALTLLHPDVVLLDWELPGKPEADRIVLIRSVAPQTRVVVISARLEAASLASEADAFVHKTDPPEHIPAVLQDRSKL